MSVKGSVARTCRGSGPRWLPREVAHNLHRVLQATAQRRRPHRRGTGGGTTPRTSASESAATARRALRAYEIGHREAWLALVDEAQDAPPDTLRLLLEAATHVWSWVQHVTHAVLDGYHAWLRDHDITTARAQQQLVERLVRGEGPPDDVLRLTRSCGLEPATPIVALAVDTSHPDRFSSELRKQDLETTIVVGNTPECLIALVQSERAGVLLTPHREQLWTFIGSAVEASRERPHLGETVEAFTEAGFLRQRAARRLHVHVNTVNYRLDRWAELTGLDVRSGQGLHHSMLALQLSSGHS